MTAIPRPVRRRALRRLLAGSSILAVAAAAFVTSQPDARASSLTLPLGSSSLMETRSAEVLSPGVTLTRIVRGTGPATTQTIASSSKGPWRISVLSIDPRFTTGHLRATFGEDLAQTEKVTDLVTGARAVAGINSSFFTFTGNPSYPGDPVGMGLYGGALLSEPRSEDPRGGLRGRRQDRQGEHRPVHLVGGADQPQHRRRP